MTEPLDLDAKTDNERIADYYAPLPAKKLAKLLDELERLRGENTELRDERDVSRETVADLEYEVRRLTAERDAAREQLDEARMVLATYCPEERSEVFFAKYPEGVL